MKLVFLFFVALAIANVAEWKKIDTSPSNERVPVSFQLKIRNSDWLQSTFEDVSNPFSPNWRKYVTRETLREMTAPDESVVRQMIEILSSNGAEDVTVYSSGDFIISQWPVHALEKYFNVQMFQFESEKTGDVIHRSLKAYTLPYELRDTVEVIGMINEFPEGHLSVSPTRNTAKSEPIVMETTDSICSNVTGMNFGYPSSSDTDLYTTVQIVCCDGSFTSLLNNPCADHPPALLSLHGKVISNTTNQLVHQFTTPYNELYNADQCYFDGDSVSCNVIFTAETQLEPYDNYWMTVQGEFVDSSVGVATESYVPVVTSPFVTPQLFADLYKIPQGLTKDFNSNNTQSVVEFSGQYYSQTDLNRFLSDMSLPKTNVLLSGPNAGTEPGDEATLDIQWLMAVGTNIPTYFWSVRIGYLLEWANQMISSENAPLVSSISYGGNEDSLPVVYRNACDSLFQRMSVLGLSIVVSSGDAGATNVGHGSDSCTINPQYPASSQFVTSVSATFFTPSDVPMCSIDYFGKTTHCSDAHIGERAVSANDGMVWTTGGGFSSLFERPWWQNDTVNAYLTNYNDLLPPSGLFNPRGRAYPDVSATGHNLMLILKDEMSIGDGTSASAPIFAGVLSLINQYLLESGEASIGFANPLLYEIAQQFPASFYDVTVGNNRCGDVLHPPHIACCDNGFQSTNGWDAVTGLGTPRVQALLDGVRYFIEIQDAPNS